jgi:hypothetical protein
MGRRRRCSESARLLQRPAGRPLKKSRSRSRAHEWVAFAPMVTQRNAVLDPELHRRRRQKVLDQLGGAPLLLRAAPETLRNGDVLYSYRQDSNFHYLTGFDEPESVLLAIPEEKRGKKSHRAILFVRPRDKTREIWDGKRYGTRGAIKTFGVDEAYEIEELHELFSKLSAGWTMLGYGLGADPAFDTHLVSHFHGTLYRSPAPQSGHARAARPPPPRSMRCGSARMRTRSNACSTPPTSRRTVISWRCASPSRGCTSISCRPRWRRSSVVAVRRATATTRSWRAATTPTRCTTSRTTAACAPATSC